MVSNFKTGRDFWDMIGYCAKYVCVAVALLVVGMYSYDYGFNKGQQSVKGTYLTPSVQDVDIQCMSWLFDIGAQQAKARICKK